MYKKAAGLVADLGYTNVMTFKGGIPAWIVAGYALDTSKSMSPAKIDTLTAADLNARLGTVQVIDIRVKSLYDMGWIPNSIRIPMERLSAEYETLSTEKPIVVVDHAGKQVLTAGRFLKSKGYSDVKRLQGGLMSWIAKGYALQR